MAGSIKLTDANALQAYVRDFRKDIIRKLFFGFPTSGIVRLEDNVKGKRVLHNLTIGALAKRYRRSFNPRQDAIKHGQREIETHLIDIDLEVNPTDYEGSYMGQFRQKGQDPKDWPFEAEIIEDVISKAASEMEVAFWQAEKTGVAVDADMIDVFDGVHKILRDEIAASNLTPIATGSITNTNAVSSLRALYKDLAPQYQLGNMDCFINPGDAILYLEDYQNKYGATAQAFQNGNTLHLDIGAINVHKCPGIKPGALLMTPKENIVYGLDGLDDSRMLNFQDQIKSIQMSMQFRIGAQLGIVDNELISLNNQH